MLSICHSVTVTQDEVMRGNQECQYLTASFSPHAPGRRPHLIDGDVELSKAWCWAVTVIHTTVSTMRSTLTALSHPRLQSCGISGHWATRRTTSHHSLHLLG